MARYARKEGDNQRVTGYIRSKHQQAGTNKRQESHWQKHANNEKQQ